MWKRIALALVPATLLLGPVMLTEQALHIPTARRSHPDASRARAIASTRWQNVSVRSSDGVALSGWLFEPAPERAAGKAVLLLHGAGDTRGGMLGFTRSFVNRGYTTLATDSRGHGVSGGMVTYGIAEREDVRRWVDLLTARAPGAKIHGMGMSMGAAILIQALPAEPRLRSVVAECSYATFREAAVERIPRLTGLPAGFASPLLATAFFYARLRYGVNLEDASPLAAIARTRTPVLLIHGLADDRTAPRQSRLLHEANPATTELWEVPGARHVRASEVAPREFEDRVTRWFEK